MGKSAEIQIGPRGMVHGVVLVAIGVLFSVAGVGLLAFRFGVVALAGLIAASASVLVAL